MHSVLTIGQTNTVLLCARIGDTANIGVEYGAVDFIKCIATCCVYLPSALPAMYYRDLAPGSDVAMDECNGDMPRRAYYVR